ncbi:hypothetical protein H9Q13_06705 [Pontibacter sp. JH31]|uniref:Uncharacterized protein n=1 Tax=Pontibacter aquaedesilientis TaxID=2766980 RepID=A0ABR7XEY8_9BACT|nr:hypothetical protein [Pontibacter aquaedesilientis]MBD1396849.1 hypothetical protein [Pontibacter aquaedesilientis]
MIKTYCFAELDFHKRLQRLQTPKGPGGAPETILVKPLLYAMSDLTGIAIGHMISL